MFDYVKTKDDDIVSMLVTKVVALSHPVVPHRCAELH